MKATVTNPAPRPYLDNTADNITLILEGNLNLNMAVDSRGYAKLPLVVNECVHVCALPHS